MRPTILRALALTFALTGCVTVPTLSGSPEAIADHISGNVVAYNQAYGQAIADQVLLNALRARDRLPLYYLSVSGITEGSYTDMTGSGTIGSIGLGQGNPNWGVGSVTGSRTNRTFPSYTLNPFGAAGKETRGSAIQFLQMNRGVLQHYWYADWPRDMLLYLMVDSVRDRTRRGNGAVYSNSTTSNLAPCRARGDANAAPCSFVDVVNYISANQDNVVIGECAAADTNSRNRCDAKLTVGTGRAARVYAAELRALDDMIYYVGSTLREGGAHPMVRPLGVYAADADRPGEWDLIERNAPLFRVSRAPDHYTPGEYAAEVTYRGEHYVAGPANSAHCEVRSANQCANTPNGGDATANVLSLLTQLIVVSQSENAQLAPQWGTPARP